MSFTSEERKERARAAIRKHYSENPEYYYERKLKRRLRNQEYVNALKNNPCTDCGNTFHFVAMDFDHRDKKEKHKSISRMVNEGISVLGIQKEIDKCDLVCANCHRVRTYLRGDHLNAG